MLAFSSDECAPTSHKGVEDDAPRHFPKTGPEQQAFKQRYGLFGLMECMRPIRPVMPHHGRHIARKMRPITIWPTNDGEHFKRIPKGKPESDMFTIPTQRLLTLPGHGRLPLAGFTECGRNDVDGAPV